MKTQRPMTEEEVRSKSCGEIIPRNAKRIPPGAYVYEFDSTKENHRHADGSYALNTPHLLPKLKLLSKVSVQSIPRAVMLDEINTRQFPVRNSLNILFRSSLVMLL